MTRWQDELNYGEDIITKRLDEMDKQHGGKRTGAGRPKGPVDLHQYSIWLPRSVVLALDREATRQRVSRSQLITSTLVDALDAPVAIRIQSVTEDG